MAYVPGKRVVLILDGYDLSAFCMSVERNTGADSLDVTTFGQTGRAYRGSLTDGSLEASGMYDASDTGPKPVIEARLGRVATLSYRPEGSSIGGPDQVCSVLVGAYKETGALFDMVKWSATFQFSGAVQTGIADTYSSAYGGIY